MRIPVVFNKTNQRLAVQFRDFQAVIIRPDAEYYEGEYEITPKVEAQTIPTAWKTMQRDMTVNAIPYFDVSNTSGGQTIYIGNEV